MYPAESTLHVIGDTHFSVVPLRAAKTKADVLALDAVARPAWRVQIGDQTDGGTDAQDTDALAFLDALDVDAVCVGNHDTFSGRTVEEWASVYERFHADQNYTLDLGFATLVVVAPDDHAQPYVLTDSTLAWLDAALATTDEAWVMCHYPLYNTIRDLNWYGTDPAGVLDEDQFRTDTRDVGSIAIGPDIQLAAILNKHPSAKVWISGHSHSAIDVDGLVAVRNVGQWTPELLSAGGYVNLLSARASDFEQASVTGWGHTQTGTSTVNDWSSSTVWSAGGGRSLHLSVTANADSTAAQMYVTPTLSGITVGDTYIVAATANLVSHGSHPPSIIVNWQDSDGTSLSSVRGTPAVAGVSDIALAARAPSGAAKMAVAFGNDSFSNQTLAGGETLDVYLDNCWICHTSDDPPGSRNIIAVNASAVYETGKLAGNRASNKICSLYLTRNGTTVDVRVRNHGSRNWDSIQGRRVTSVPVPP